MLDHFNTNLHLCLLASLMFLIGVIAWRMYFFQKYLGNEPRFQAKIKLSAYLLCLPFLLCAVWFCMILNMQSTEKQTTINKYKQKISQIDTSQIWEAPDPADIPDEYPNKKQILYGRNLIANTDDYFGKNGCVKPNATNGMNCQNCHLNAGTKPFGNNYAAVFSTYPKFRARSGTQETIIKRINDCFQRSLNGEALDSTSKEMKAIVAYIEWLGSGVPKGFSPKGVGITKLKFLDRAADPAKGQLVYQAKCASCHAPDGQGLGMPVPEEARLESNNGKRYPPLWGEGSYNEAAGLFRLSNLAGYVKSNMPFGASYQNPQLTDEEAWDVAAFINAQPHPKHKFLDKDFPNIAKKPFDHPFSPFKDTFSEQQHKFGPFQAVVDFYKK
jgi:thiosulfate dehydrogenase